MIKRKSGGSFVDAANVKRRSGGGWVNVSSVKRRVGGSWVQVWPTTTPITATANFTHVTGSAGGFTSSTNITATGGSGATKTFSWAKISGIGTIKNPNQAFTRFHSNSAGVGVFRCTVDDGTYTATVDVTAEWA